MTIEMITETVHKLQKKYDETDPLRLTHALKILVRYVPMGLYDGCCKGFFMTACRQRHITVNSDLSEPLQRIVLTHELGHCVLHAKNTAGASFHDITLFDDTDHREYEANIFAAEFLLPDERILPLLDEDHSFFEVAKELCIPFELLDFKFRILKKKGYPIDAPVISQGNFLKNLEKDVPCQTKANEKLQKDFQK